MRRLPTLNRFVLTGVVIITAIIAASGLIVDMQRRASIDAFETATLNLGNGMSQQTTQSITTVSKVLTEIGRAATAKPAATADDIAAAMRSDSMAGLLAAKHDRLFPVAALLLVDAQGRIVATSPNRTDAALDAAGRDVFAHFSLSAQHDMFIGAPVRNPVSGVWTALMAQRLDDAQGGFAGLVAAELSLTALQEFYHLAMPARRSVYVLRRDGTILVRFPQRDDEIGRKVPEHSPWYAIVARGGGTYRGSAYFDATEVVDAVRALRDLPLVVEASVAETDVLMDWYRQRFWVVIGCVSSIICALTLLRLFASQYHRVKSSELTLAMKNAQLDAAHEQLDATLANLSQGVCFFDKDLKVVVCNRRYCELFDLPDGAIEVGMSVAEVARLRIAAGSLPHGSLDEYLRMVDAIVGDGKPSDAIVELADGRSLSRHVQPLPGRGTIVTHEDVTERRQAEAKIAYMARHDMLTGLANRSLFQSRMEQALALAERGKGFAVLCLDLDRFKAVNDTFGHGVGDSLLRAVADRLRDVVRETDTVARLGGDEFAILQTGVSEPAETSAIARRIVQTINEPFELDGHLLSIGTSVGISLAPRDSAHPLELMNNADLALYRAKREGRGNWRFFEPAMDAEARRRRALEGDLRNALSSEQFEIYYQPVVSTRKRNLTGFEALLRWRHPTLGILPPGEFLSVAEEIGLIADIGAWVLQRACAEAATWPDHLRVAVNLSTRQFRGRPLVDIVSEAIEANGIAPERLQLEITEAVSLREDQAPLAMLRDLHTLGVRVALDDFGTGHSALSYMRSFPFDTLKIDRTFISAIETHEETAAIVRGIISLASSLGVSITAEGVETQGQYDFLAAFGCAEVQGYLISRPVPANEVSGLIERLSGQLAWA